MEHRKGNLRIYMKNEEMEEYNKLFANICDKYRKKRNCRVCSEELTGNQNYCYECGTNLEGTPVYCDNCGIKLR